MPRKCCAAILTYKLKPTPYRYHLPSKLSRFHSSYSHSLILQSLSAQYKSPSPKCQHTRSSYAVRLLPTNCSLQKTYLQASSYNWFMKTVLPFHGPYSPSQRNDWMEEISYLIHSCDQDMPANLRWNPIEFYSTFWPQKQASHNNTSQSTQNWISLIAAINWRQILVEKMCLIKFPSPFPVGISLMRPQ